MEEKTVRCPHCQGKTKCSCSTCGQAFVIDTYKGFQKDGQRTEVIEGICKVCNGTGKIKSE